jgi:hypothetical protein
MGHCGLAARLMVMTAQRWLSDHRWRCVVRTPEPCGLWGSGGPAGRAVCGSLLVWTLVVRRADERERAGEGSRSPGARAGDGTGKSAQVSVLASAVRSVLGCRLSTCGPVRLRPEGEGPPRR